MFTITFKGEKNTAHDLQVAARPSIPAPAKRATLLTVPGRDGALIETDGAYDPIEIAIELNYIAPDPAVMGAKFRDAKAWLTGSGDLAFSDDQEVFYRVLEMGITGHNRRADTGADITATAICEPYTYYIAGQTARTGGGSVNNPYDTAQPVYTITGNGVCTLTVNGNALRANVGQNLTIDTARLIAYRQDGAVQNAQTSGAGFDDLWLKPGANTISITSGFTLRYIPNWRAL